MNTLDLFKVMFYFLRWVNHLQTQHLEEYVLLGIWYFFSDTAISNIKFQVSNEKNPGWLGYVGDCPTQ